MKHKTQNITLKTRDSTIQIKAAQANTFLSRGLGLSFKKTMPEDGMLFSFQKKTRTPFWMWGMRFPIDIAWIRDGKILNTHKNLSPPSKWHHHLLPLRLKLYRPEKPVDYALELPAGFVKRHGLEAGTEVWIEE